MWNLRRTQGPFLAVEPHSIRGLRPVWMARLGELCGPLTDGGPSSWGVLVARHWPVLFTCQWVGPESYMGEGLIYKVGRGVVPGGASCGANTVLCRMEAFMGRNDPMMPQPRSHSQLAEDWTTHNYTRTIE